MLPFPDHKDPQGGRSTHSRVERHDPCDISGDTEEAFSKTQTRFELLSQRRQRRSSHKGHPPSKPRAATPGRGETSKALPFSPARRQRCRAARPLGGVSPEVADGTAKQTRLCSQMAWLCAQGGLKSLWRNDANEEWG